MFASESSGQCADRADSCEVNFFGSLLNHVNHRWCIDDRIGIRRTAYGSDPTCNGRWLDHHELDLLEAVRASEAERRATIEYSKRESELNCPVCGKQMLAFNYRAYDLELDGDFQPKNTDGEISEFYLWPVARVMDTVAETREFKSNCNLIVIDFLIRRGLISPDRSDYIELNEGLRR